MVTTDETMTKKGSTATIGKDAIMNKTGTQEETETEIGTGVFTATATATVTEQEREAWIAKEGGTDRHSHPEGPGPSHRDPAIRKKVEHKIH